MTIFPDRRAFVVLCVAASPVFVLWTVVWLRRPHAGTSAFWAGGVLLLIGCLSLMAKTVRARNRDVVQGWGPFATTIAFADIGRIHNVYVSSRYGSAPCLAITARDGRQEIRLPIKSFSVAKRQRLVRLLVGRAPDARVDRAVEATLA